MFLTEFSLSHVQILCLNTLSPPPPPISHISSLRGKRYLTSVSNACEAAAISLFWAPKDFNELPEVRLEFPFKLIGISTVPFLTGQSWLVLKSWYTGEGLEQRFRLSFADGLSVSAILCYECSVHAVLQSPRT